jgi:tetratricopeptide (TPR) repeat protein
VRSLQNINPQALLEHARRIELQIASSRLLKYLFPENDNAGKVFGHYRFLEKEIEERPEFLQALLKEDHELALRKWMQVLADHKSDAQFYHGIATIYGEYSIASLDKEMLDGGLWLLSTSLWIFLLCSDEFWKYFSEARFTERGSSVRELLESQQQLDLFHEAWQSILSIHNRFGRQDFYSRRYEKAKVHLSCLDLCRRKEDVIIATLGMQGIDCNLTLEDDRLEKVRNMAEKLLDEFGSILVDEAEKITENADAIKDLPSGIRKNYEGGIQHLENFIKLNITVVRVLRASLQWYNDWCFDLYVTKNIEHLKKLMQSAGHVADSLAPNCVKLRGYSPENQALSQHFMFRGFIVDAPKQAIKEYREALDWNPENENAKELLGSATQMVLTGQFEVAIEYVERKQFKEAFEALDAVEEYVTDNKQIQEVRAGIYFRYAHMLEDDGQFHEALAQARKAQQLSPDTQAIQSLVEELQELEPEEENLRRLHQAQEKIEKKQYDIAIKEASQIPFHSKFYSRACSILSAAYFIRGIDAAKRMQYDNALDNLEKAFALNGMDEERDVIGSQLKIIRQEKMGYELKQALDTNPKNWKKAELILRQAISDQPSFKIKKELESQLSDILNAHGVSLANETQETYQRFREAQQMIITGAKSFKKDGFVQRSATSMEMKIPGESCAVCGKIDAKIRVILQLLSMLGSFPETGTEMFWQVFNNELCPSCKLQIDLINNKKHEALELLEESIRLDRNNDVAKKNLEALKGY